MKVILLKPLGKLGKADEVVEVKPGFARNYLIPKGFAFLATEKNFKKLEEIKKRKAKFLEDEKHSLSALKEKIEAISLTIAAEIKDKEDIYGSVNEAQILKALEEEEIKLNKGGIILEEPIRKLGVYTLKVNLHPQIEANLRVWVVKK